jgi:hypothetical protein
MLLVSKLIAQIHPGMESITSESQTSQKVFGDQVRSKMEFYITAMVVENIRQKIFNMSKFLILIKNLQDLELNQVL